MSMPTLSLSHTAFVPHGLTAPFRGTPGGPLAGLTAAVKDMFDIVGTRTSGGSPDWLNTHPPASSSAAAVLKILDAGAIVVGKTVCDEFFYSITGANAHYGTPANPRAPGRLPGGSSSGSAAATASGACDFALGSDTGGSVPFVASMVFGPRTAESISPAPWRWHRPSTSQGGSRTARASSVLPRFKGASVISVMPVGDVGVVAGKGTGGPAREAC